MRRFIIITITVLVLCGLIVGKIVVDTLYMMSINSSTRIAR